MAITLNPAGRIEVDGVEYAILPVKAIPATMPVTTVKAFGAHTRAKPWLNHNVGPEAMVALIGIGLTGWTHNQETAKAFADGYNRAIDLFEAWLAAAPPLPEGVRRALEGAGEGARPLAYTWEENDGIGGSPRRKYSDAPPGRIRDPWPLFTYPPSAAQQLKQQAERIAELEEWRRSASAQIIQSAATAGATQRLLDSRVQQVEALQRELEEAKGPTKGQAFRVSLDNDRIDRAPEYDQVQAGDTLLKLSIYPDGVPFRKGRTIVRVTADGKVQFAEDATADDLRDCIKTMAQRWMPLQPPHKLAADPEGQADRDEGSAAGDGRDARKDEHDQGDDQKRSG